MRVTRIEVEAAQGKAVFRREGEYIKTAVFLANMRCPVYSAHARKAEGQEHLARLLQRDLDGCRGTQGDVAAYQRVIEMLAD